MRNFWDTIVQPIFQFLKPNTIVEVGVDKAINTRNLLKYCVENKAILYSIDPSPNCNIEEIKSEYPENFVFYQSMSLNALHRIHNQDVVLIDGDHNWYTVYNELKLIEKNAVEHNYEIPLILLHDIGWPYGRRDLYYNPDTIPAAFQKPFKQKGIKYNELELQEKGGINSHLNNSIYENNLQNGVLTAVEDFLSESNSDLEFVKLPGFYGLGIILSVKLLSENQLLADFINKIKDIPEFLKDYIETLDKCRINENIQKSEKQHILREKEATLQQLQDQLTAKEEQINSITEELTAKEEQINSITEELTAKEEQMHNMKQMLAEQADQIRRLRIEKISKLEEELQVKENLLQKEKQSNDELKGVSELEKRKNRDLEKNIRELRIELNMLSNWIEELEHGTNELLNSNRWKVGNKIGDLHQKLLFKHKTAMPHEHLESIFSNFNHWKEKKKTNVELVSSGIGEQKIIVYTCVFGDYEQVKDPLYPQNGVEYILFTDNPNIKSNVWNVKVINEKLENPRRTSRKPKILAHKYLPNHDVSVYIDSSLQLKIDNIHEMVNECLEGKGIALYKHPIRNCIYEEIDFCIKNGKIDKNDAYKQKNKYLREGFPENYGLFENAFIFRKNTSEIQQLNQLWWNEYKNGSERDQHSLMYCLWKLKIEANTIKKGRQFRDNPYVIFYRHRYKRYGKGEEKKPTVNWVTGGEKSKGWAYENNSYRLAKELKDFCHVYDSYNTTDIALYFDVRIHDQVGSKGKVNILRLGGPRPLQILYNYDLEKQREELSKFDAIIALSPELYEIAKEANQNSYLLPNGIDLREWKYNYSLNRNKFIAGFAGNLSTSKEKEYKGFNLVKEACERLGIELLYFEKGKKQIPHERMYEEFYSKIDCLVHPVKAGKEGSSNVIMEALAVGVPVITTKEAGFHGHMLTDNENVIFCERDVVSIMNKIDLLKNNKKICEKLSKNGRRFCEQHHNITEIAKSYESIMKYCTDNKLHISFVPYREPFQKFASSRLRAGYILDSINRKIPNKYYADMNNFDESDIIIINQLISKEKYTKLITAKHERNAFVVYDVVDRYYNDFKYEADGIERNDTFRKLVNLADLITVANKIQRDELKQLGIDKPVEIIPDGIDYYEKIDKTYREFNGKVVWFGYTGRGNLSSAKWALEYIRDKTEFDVFAICNKESFRLEGIQVIEWNYDTFVEDLKKFSICFLSHSQEEKQKSNNKLLVAIANGIPAIVSGSSSYAEVLKKFNLDYAIVSTVNELRTALSILSNESERKDYINKLQPYVFENYSYDSIVDQYDVLITNYYKNYSVNKDNSIYNVAVCTHNLNDTEGAPKSLYELVLGLKNRYNLSFRVFSPLDGPLREKYEQEGIRVELLGGGRSRKVFNKKTSLNEYNEFIKNFEKRLRDFSPHAMIANTADSIYATKVANLLGIPIIWIIRESREPLKYYDYLSHKIKNDAIKQIELTDYIVFVSKETQKLWCDRYNIVQSTVIPNGLNTNNLSSKNIGLRKKARQKLGINDSDVMFLNVGVISDRKGQEDFINALRYIESNNISKAHFYLVGARENGYINKIRDLVINLPSEIEQKVHLINETGDVGEYYLAADVFVFNSRIESYPRVILEAMYYGLPIITTPVFGILEQTIENGNALYYSPGNAKELADHIEKLMVFDYIKQNMSNMSNVLFDQLLDYDQMINKYYKLIISTIKDKNHQKIIK